MPQYTLHDNTCYAPSHFSESLTVLNLLKQGMTVLHFHDMCTFPNLLALSIKF